MAYVAHPNRFHAAVPLGRVPANMISDNAQIGSPSGETNTETAMAHRGWLRRLYDMFMESRQKSANRYIAAYLAQRGHRLTDSAERELNQYLFNSGWNSRR